MVCCKTFGATLCLERSLLWDLALEEEMKEKINFTLTDTVPCSEVEGLENTFFFMLKTTYFEEKFYLSAM